MEWKAIKGLPPLYEELGTVDLDGDGVSRSLCVCRPYLGGRSSFLIKEDKTFYSVDIGEVVNDYVHFRDGGEQPKSHVQESAEWTELERRYIELASVYLDRFREDRALSMGWPQTSRKEAEASIRELDRKLIGLASALDCDTWGLR